MKEVQLTHSHLASLYGRLALYCGSGIPMAEALRLLDGDEAALYASMADTLESGCPLADAMKEAGCFTASDIGMMMAGERAGNPAKTLASLAAYHERRKETRRMLTHTMIYPLVLGFVMLAVLVILITKVLPVFDEVYRSLGSGLDGAAGALLHFGKALGAALPYIEILLAVLVLAILVVWMIPGAKASMARFVRRRIGDRGIARRMNSAAMAQALAAAVSGSLTPQEGLVLAKERVADCPAAAHRCDAGLRVLEEGGSLADALGEAGIFTAADLRLLGVGERTGQADAVLEKLASRVTEEAQAALEARLMMVEPAMVLITSVLVGILLLGVMLPLLGVMKAIG